jgi:hypothetical protein
MKNIIAIIILTTLSLSASAANTEARVQILEIKVAKIERFLGDQQSYIGGSLVDLKKLADDNGLKLNVKPSVNDTQIRKYHAILQSCFKKIKKDFPRATFNIEEILLSDDKAGGYPKAGTTISVISYKNTLVLFTSGTAQSCYNTMFSEGLN